jgi:hypothetical protein
MRLDGGSRNRPAVLCGNISWSLSSIEKVLGGDRWIHETKFDGYRVQLQLKSASKA